MSDILAPNLLFSIYKNFPIKLFGNQKLISKVRNNSIEYELNTIWFNRQNIIKQCEI